MTLGPSPAEDGSLRCWRAELSARPDPSLTLTRTQYPAIVDNTRNARPIVYAGFAGPCNSQQFQTAHSYGHLQEKRQMTRWDLAAPLATLEKCTGIGSALTGSCGYLSEIVELV